MTAGLFESLLDLLFDKVAVSFEYAIMLLPFYLAWRYFFTQSSHPIVRFVSWCSVGGIALGVGALITVTSVVEGFQEAFENNVRSVTGDLIIFDRGEGILNVPQFSSTLRKNLPEIESMTPFMALSAVVVANSRSKGCTVYGIEPGSVESVLTLNRKNIQGTISLSQIDEISEGNKKPGVFLGRLLSKKLKVKQGDEIHLILPLDPESYQFKPRRITLQYKGSLPFGLADQDSKAVIVSNKTIQTLMNIQTVMGMRLKLHPQALMSLGLPKPEIVKKLQIAYPFPYLIKSWHELHNNIFESLLLEKNVLTIIMLMVVLVASFTLSSTIVLNVMERTQDIAILNVLGLAKWKIMWVFVAVGALLSLLGIILGLMGGSALLWVITNYNLVDLPESIYNVSRLPIKIVPAQWLRVVLSSFLIATLSALVPTRRISKISPSTILKAEM